MTRTDEQIRNILGISIEKRMDLHKRLNDFVDRRILKVEISPDSYRKVNIGQVYNNKWQLFLILVYNFTCRLTRDYQAMRNCTVQ